MIVLAALLAVSTALAQDLPGLLGRWRAAERLDLRGTVTSSVYFPPRAEPTRTINSLPRVEVLPGLVRRNFTLAGPVAEAVAGRDARRFDLTPNNPGANSWTIWLDDQWNVPLAYEVRSAAGELQRRAVFEAVQGEPRRRANAVAPRTQSPELRRAVLAALPGLRLPRGFEPIGLATTPRGLEITLSDGLNVLALVVADKNVRAGEGVFSRNVAGRFVWLIGSLPSAQLRTALANVGAVEPSALGTFSPPPASNP